MAKQTPNQKPFSQELQGWIKGKNKKDFDSLIEVFEEKAFAIVFLIMMALPALPIPTGGVTHVTEIITALCALQLIAGRRTIWLPESIKRKVNVGKLMSGKGGSKLISTIKWFERWSRRRLSGLLILRPTLSVLGLIVLIFTVAAFIAPPFSGLDTLPALGVVTISLGLILEDVVIVLTGIILGVGGIGLEVTAGGALYHGLSHLF